MNASDATPGLNLKPAHRPAYPSKASILSALIECRAGRIDVLLKVVWTVWRKTRFR